MSGAIPVSVILRQEWLGLKELSGVVGWLGALRIGTRMKARLKAGEPWENLEAPASEAEAWSREQIAPAVLLYDELRLHGVSDSVQAVQTIVVRSAVPWMRHAVGQVSREELAGLKSEERRPWLMGKMSPFLNMNVGAVEVAAEQASFEVTHCHFPNLCTRVGVPELAPVFCAVDSHFFGHVQPEIELHRPSTLAGGGETCDFNLKFRPKVNSPEDE